MERERLKTTWRRIANLGNRVKLGPRCRTPAKPFTRPAFHPASLVKS